MKKVYLIISAYNEEESLAVLHAGLHEELNKISFEDYELVFVNDGSRDQTLQVLRDLQKKILI
ncbi:glycosyltransferase [Chryseobacterium sp. 3008163]|nr:glycosyltransferase [Chryseobacterium sp. 3008163]AYN00524.1 glycosyltransferase [Chryseobacterium sp. 3008163]